MSKIKRLDTYGFWDISFDEIRSCLEEEIDPVFNKEGRYFDRKLNLCWHEAFDGNMIRAFVERDAEQFNFTLITLLHRPLTEKEVEAARTILYYEKNRKLSSLLGTDSHWKRLRNIRRGTRIWLTRK